MSQILVTGEAKIRDIQGPVVSNSGVITALDGDASQYVRGDGTLADFPTSTGGGSSVSYYLNSSVSQGTIGGVAYKELSKDPISGAGTDITISANGYVASYITDANDPSLLEVPGGNFNCEFYFSVNSNNHNPYVYAELYKYDGSTFTLLGSSQSVPEYLTNGTTLSPYYFAIPVATAALTITDRLAVRIYVNVDTRVVTLHTENNHLCQVVTTFSKGLISLNNLTRQNQFFATGTSGTDFNISSATATHTFNLPVASAANTGKLSSTDWSTFNGKVPYTGATANLDLGAYSLFSASVGANFLYANGASPVGGYISLKQGDATIINIADYNNIYANGTKYVLIANAGTTNYKLASFDLASLTNNTSRTFTLPDLSGTLALLEGTQTFSGSKTFSALTAFTFANGTRMDYGLYLSKGAVPSAFSGSTTNIYSDATTNNIVIRDNSSIAKLDFNNSTQTYTFPAASGTVALTSNLSSYVPYSGATGAVNLGFNLLTTNSINLDGNSVSGVLNIKSNSSITTSGAGYVSLVSGNVNQLSFVFNGGNSATFTSVSLSASRTYSLPDAGGTIALTSDLGSYVTLATTQTISAIKKYSDYQQFDNGIKFKDNAVGSSLVSGYVSVWFNKSETNNFIGLASAATSPFYYTYEFPNASGTIALTSNLSTYLPLAGGTLTGALSGTSATFSGGVTTPSITNGGQFKMDYGANAVSRSWRLISDSYNFGDFSIQQSTTQSGSTYADRLLISASGNVGIGTSSPAATLQVVGDVYVGSYHSANKLCLGADTNDFLQYSSSLDGILMASYGATAFYTGASSAERMRISSAGVVTIANLAGTGSRAVLADASGNLSAPVSDISVKENITFIGYGLSEILKMNPVWYNFIDDYKNYGEGRQNGNIAQEMQKIIPEAVFVTPSTGKMGINYDQMHAVYIKAIQELKLEIEELKALINK
jgi:hypothetical protein